MQVRKRSRVTSLSVLFVLSLTGCVYAPKRTIPDPLPEVLAWALAERPAGAVLGAELIENDSGALEDLAFGSGLVVRRVTDGSPAARAGLRVGDVVVAADGVELFAPQDMLALLEGRADGDVLALEVERGDTVFAVPITLSGARGDAGLVQALYHLDPARSRAAWGDGERGAVLVARPTDGPVRKLPVGTLVTRIDDRAVLSGRGLVRELAVLAPGAEVVLTGRAPNGDEREWSVHLLDEGRVTTRASVPVLFTYDADLEADRRKFVVLDLWLISLVRYERDGSEKHWRVLRFFEWSSGVGELGS